MHKGTRIALGLTAALGFLAASGMSSGLAAESGILIYRPTAQTLTYELNVESLYRLDASQPRFQVIRKHKDILGIDFRVEPAQDGLLDQIVTVTAINPRKYLPWQFTGGSQWKREQIVGNSQRTRIDLLGRVKEAKGIFQFSSGLYYGTEDGPALDMYRVLGMLHPQLPLRVLKKGDTWAVKDEVTVTDAPSLAEAGVTQKRHQSLDAKIRRNLKYRLIGFVDRKGVQAAHIGVKGRFWRKDAAQQTTGGQYKEANGRVEGEFFLDEKRGIVLEATLNSQFYESFAEDGPTVVHWLNPKQMIFLVLEEDQTTVPLGWRVKQTARYELRGPKDAAAAVTPAKTKIAAPAHDVAGD